MKDVVKNLKEFGYRKSTKGTLKKKNIVAKTEAYKAPGEITDATSDLLDKIVVFDSAISVAQLDEVPRQFKVFKGLLNVLKLEDDSTQFLNINSKVQYANEIEKVLKEENDRICEDKELDLKFFENYDNVKEEINDNKKLIEEQKDITYLEKHKLKGHNDDAEIERIQERIDESKKVKYKLSRKIAYLKNMRERAIVKGVLDLNKENRFTMVHRILGNVAGFAASVIEILNLPVNKVVVAGLQIPTLFGKLINKIDEHIIKKFRDKAENSRKENALKNQLEEVKETIGTEKFNEIVKDEKDNQKQKEMLEKSEDVAVKAAIKLSKKSQRVLFAKPAWYLRIFKPYVLEDEEKMRNIANSIFKVIKDLPDFNNIEEQIKNVPENKRDLVEQGLKEANASKERVQAVLDIVGIDNSEDYINAVKDYQNKKYKDIEKVNGNKIMLTEAQREFYSNKKNDLKNKLVDAMKQKI